MRINLFYVIIAALIITAGVFFLESRELPSRIVKGAEQRPTPPPAEVLTTATSPLPPPTNLTGTVTTGHHVLLTWSVTTNTDVRRYRVVRNNLLIAEVTEPRFADVYTLVGRQYGYYVQAIDGQGRFSLPSNFIIVDTSPALTSTTPSAPVATTPTSSTNRTPKPTNTNPVVTPTPTTDEPDEEETPITAPPPTTTTNTSPSPSVDHEITVTEQGVFSPPTITIHTGDTVTFVYTSGEGDEVVLQFSPSISATVKLDHEHTTKTVTFATTGTYTYRRADSSAETGTIIVTTP